LIIIDTREPDSVNRHLMGLSIPKDEKIVPLAMPVGDILISINNLTLPTTVAEFVSWAGQSSIEYKIEDILDNPQQAAVELLMPRSIVIERKTPHDFLESIADGRLFDQARRLVEIAKYPMFVITGFFGETSDGKVLIGKDTTKWSWWSIQMAIMRLQYAGCCIITVRENELGSCVGKLWNWLYEGPKLVRRKAIAPLIPLPAEEEFLCGLPNIGPNKAHDVMQYTGNLAMALHFLTDENSPDLPGRPENFGKATIGKIRDFIGVGDGESLVIG
jgi:hypothetical protein